MSSPRKNIANITIYNTKNKVGIENETTNVGLKSPDFAKLKHLLNKNRPLRGITPIANSRKLWTTDGGEKTFFNDRIKVIGAAHPSSKTKSSEQK